MPKNMHSTASAAATQDGRAHLAPGLYLVATPIGNLGDITLRAVETLKSADAIACEDTRTSRTLLEHYGVRTPMISYHEHNAAQMRPKLLSRLAAGERIALISDAGTPLISDPGYKLAREAREAGHTVTALPGACALIVALSLSALPTDRFCFLGFLPPKSSARKTALKPWVSAPATLVLYESPRRLAACLADMAEILGPREAAVARELTKRFEEVRRGTLAELAAHYAAAGAPKGEVVILAGPPEKTAEPEGKREEDAEAALREALDRLPLKEAAREVAERFGLPRKVLYQKAVGWKKEEEGSS